jgi:hypothetical protein
MVAILLLAFASSSAHAVFAVPVPEPGILELLAVTALAMIVVGLRQRHKNELPIGSCAVFADLVGRV